jgi:hypothetical protein
MRAEGGQVSKKHKSENDEELQEYYQELCDEFFEEHGRKQRSFDELLKWNDARIAEEEAQSLEARSPANLKKYFLANCREQAALARTRYRGPVDDRVRAAVRRVADAWTKLADEMASKE